MYSCCSNNLGVLFPMTGARYNNFGHECCLMFSIWSVFMDRRVSCICHLNCLTEFACSTILNWDNCITALILSYNGMFVLIFLTLHICVWFSKSKAPFTLVLQHRELNLNNRKKFAWKEKRRKNYTALVRIHFPGPTCYRWSNMPIVFIIVLCFSLLL